MSKLIDEFGRDLGEIIEVSAKDSGDPDTRAYDVYVHAPDMATQLNARMAEIGDAVKAMASHEVPACGNDGPHVAHDWDEHWDAQHGRVAWQTCSGMEDERDPDECRTCGEERARHDPDYRGARPDHPFNGPERPVAGPSSVLPANVPESMRERAAASLDAWHAAAGRPHIESRRSGQAMAELLAEMLDLDASGPAEVKPTHYLAVSKPASAWNDHLRYHAADPASGVIGKHTTTVQYKSLCGISYLIKAGDDFGKILHLDQCERCLKIIG